MQQIEVNPCFQDSVGITIDCEYFSSRSAPEQGQFCWLYTVTLSNHCQQSVQLFRRHWQLIDAHGMQQDIQGLGIDTMGHQPQLGRDEFFEYSSFVYLTKQSGIMLGHFDFKKESGGFFTIKCPPLSLDSFLCDQFPN